MESFQAINMLNGSKDFIRETALQYDFGQIKSEKYGEATLSGYLLFLAYNGLPLIYVEQMDEKANIWLKKMGLEKYQAELIEKQKIQRMLAYCAPDVHPEKLEVCFSLLIFGTTLDDSVNRLTHLNENNPVKHQEDIQSLAENLNSVIENRGSSTATEAAISKLNPIFKPVCIALSYTCRRSFQQMDRDDYKRFARELSSLVIVQKWMHEYRILPYKKNEFLDVRIIDVLTCQPLFAVFWAKNIRLSKEIRSHPTFRRYFKNTLLHTTRVNDILSLKSDMVDNNTLNIVFLRCRKNSLQESIYEEDKATNDLIIDLLKDKFMLMTHFPANENLKNFIKTVENMINGALTWYQETGRYGRVKIARNVVEHTCDYNSWLEQVGSYAKNMTEPRSSSESDVAIPSGFQ